MAKHSSRVFHSVRGYRMDRTFAEQVMREHCSITWEVKGVSVRDTTDEERINLRAAQVQEACLRELKDGILGRNDLPNVKFEPPKTTKYRAPREAYEEMEAPLGVRVCKWPRKSREWPSRSHVDQVIAQMETLS